MIIPSIDLQSGNAVQLIGGKEKELDAGDPRPIADLFGRVGEIAVIDLDAALGTGNNRDTILDLLGRAPCRVGGGIRDEDSIQEYLDAGVRYVILGTKAITAPHLVSDVCAEFPGHIIVGLDVREGKVAIEGWSKLSRHDALDLAQHFEQDGVAAIVFTDISRDGMMDGLNIEATVAFAQELSIPVIASGGITNLDDIRALCAVESEGVSAAITGRAIYEGTIDLAEAQTLADKLSGSDDG